MEAHLSMIQGVVNRLAQSSFLLKGWSVVLVSALLAFAAASSEEAILVVAFLPALAFWGLDGYFLWQERLYRALYDQVRLQEEADLNYGLDTRAVPNLRPQHKWLNAVSSRTLLVFHGAILATIVAALVVTVG